MSGRELLLMRHAKSAWDTDAASDFERPLSERGRKAAPRMARWMAERELVPDLVISSPAWRAAETAERVLRALDVESDECLCFDERIYEGWGRSLLSVLADCPAGARRVLLVGHNPGLEDLVGHLAGGAAPRPPAGKFFPTGAVARFRMPDDWTDLPAGCADLVEIARPKEV